MYLVKLRIFFQTFFPRPAFLLIFLFSWHTLRPLVYEYDSSSAAIEREWYWMTLSIHCGNGVCRKAHSFSYPTYHRWLKDSRNPCRDSEQMANKKINVRPIISMIIKLLHEIWANKVCSPFVIQQRISFSISSLLYIYIIYIVKKTSTKILM